MRTQHPFKPSRELTFNTVQSDRKRLEKRLKDAKLSHLCFDLSNVQRCDSAGLALLIETKRLCERYEKSLEIRGMSAEIRALIEFCGVRALFD